MSDKVSDWNTKNYDIQSMTEILIIPALIFLGKSWFFIFFVVACNDRVKVPTQYTFNLKYIVSYFLSLSAVSTANEN